ncbi:uncharacterized protein AMSG_07533 [Thecamonas trahens ATCC 50062]|uniref:OB domain-containing protein n=1 Tax=Thecamonas trahens ATCC 50062 TaxID=461836 RepID=A0A0L0DHE6_THETB|nr:hypothetical protein AMSG_07533 [Thecamonas trahens ATCC 50062]KNC51620.1 hypothetical protein AMSG_07533 [Thecamonas trahens ATCC 50062]|eukprot:XP_013756015.1 hypothetical protein AMSG_07533 [Thecamonas trahens ATCC 50062]
MAQTGVDASIAELTPELRVVNTAFVVLDKLGVRTIKSGAKVTTFKVADATGSVTFAVWDDVGSMLEPGEIFSLRGGYTELHAARADGRV